MNHKGVLIVLSGFSGSGKGTVVKRLMAQYAEQYALSISATTRNPRKNLETGQDEVHGREYFFISKEAFEQRIAEGDFLEHAVYGQNYYGTPKGYVMSQLDAGKDVILEIEMQGALQVKENYPEALLVFMTPPSADELYRRLVGRKTETPEAIQRRMEAAKVEAAHIHCYDYLLVNDDLDTCVETLRQMIALKHYDTAQNTAFIAEIQKQLDHVEI